MKIRRIIQPKIESYLGKGRAIIIYGPRQVGKTTLVRDIEKGFSGETLYLNCDEPSVVPNLENKTSTELRAFIGKKDLVIIDEAQRVGNIGITIKLLVDNFPTMQIIATGSSSLELANKIAEPLTGRVYTFHLYPFSISELMQVYSPIELKTLLPRLLIYGTYPPIVTATSDSERILQEISQSYLLKDILSFQKIRNPAILTKLLAALALQVGGEVATTELGNLVGIDKETVNRYIDLLEKTFIISTLSPLSRNLRKEIGKMRKVYFLDTGIRNALINNLNPLELRGDIGGLWENFVIMERRKRNNNLGVSPNVYFWRTWTKQEIDYVEEAKGKLSGYEIKWKEKKFRPPKDFLSTYAGSSVVQINQNNFFDFVG